MSAESGEGVWTLQKVQTIRLVCGCRNAKPFTSVECVAEPSSRLDWLTGTPVIQHRLIYLFTSCSCFMTEFQNNAEIITTTTCLYATIYRLTLTQLLKLSSERKENIFGSFSYTYFSGEITSFGNPWEITDHLLMCLYFWRWSKGYGWIGLCHEHFKPS